jgi:hypothetical protein
MAMTQPEPDADSHPAKPRLSVEWRLAITLPTSGLVVCYPADSQGDAVDRGRKCGHSTWHIEKRYVAEWKPVTVELRNAILAVDRPKPRREVDPGTDGDRAE